MKIIKALFKQAVRHKKLWRCEEYIKKINNIRPATYKFVRKMEIMQGNLPTEQVSNRRTQNNRNRNKPTRRNWGSVSREISLRGVNPRASGCIASKKMGTSRRRSQSVGNNDKQRFKITERRF
jgi:hypothetical protein